MNGQEDGSQKVSIEDFQNLFENEHSFFNVLIEELKKFPVKEIANLGKAFPSEEKFKELGKLEKLENLKKLEILNKIDELDKLQQLEELTRLDNLKELQNLDSLDKLNDLDKLNQLNKLHQLDSLGSLDNLESLHHLERLQGLDELKALDSLNKLNNLQSLDKLEDLSNLDQLSQLSTLKDFDESVENLKSFLPTTEIRDLMDKHIKLISHLDELNNLEKLDSLNQLVTLKELERLNELHSLKELRMLDELGKLSKLDEISRLSRLDELSRLEKLTNLEQLSELSNLNELNKLGELNRLDELEKLKNLELLKDEKVDKTITRLDNISFLKDSTAKYAGKYFLSIFLDIFKVAIVAISFLYFIQTDFGKDKTNSALVQLGFGDSLMTSFALDYLSRTNSSKVLEKSYEKALSKIDFEINNINYLSLNRFLTPKIAHIYQQFNSYKFKHKNYDLQKDTLQKIKLYLLSQENLFRKYFIYSKGKELHSDKDLAIMNKVSIFLKNKKYGEAIKHIASLENKEYPEIIYSIRTATLGLHLSSPEDLKTIYSEIALD